MLFFVAGLSHYCEFKVEHTFPNHFLNHRWTTTMYCQVRFKLFHHYLLYFSFPIIFSTIVEPPPCTARYVLNCSTIIYFISVSVAFGRRFNAGSQKKTTLRECPYIFSWKVSWKATPTALSLIIVIKEMRFLSYY